MKLIDTFIQAAESAAATVEAIPPEAEALTRSLLRLTEGSDAVLLALAGDLDPGLFGQLQAVDYGLQVRLEVALPADALVVPEPDVALRGSRLLLRLGRDDQTDKVRDRLNGSHGSPSHSP